MKATLIQMNSQDDLEQNLTSAEKFIDAAAKEDGADFVVLPEYFAYFHDDPKKMQSSGEVLPGEIYWRMSAAAKRNNVTLHAGSIVEKRGYTHHNTTVVFGADGSELARYSKIHLFALDTPTKVFRESDMISAGQDVVVYSVGDVKIGCAICYDIRFPELFRKLRDLGADVIVLPAAFTLTTGKDHWEVLLRARAVETQTYILAAAQTLNYGDARLANYGHSLIVDPWGHVTAKASDVIGMVTGKIDPSYVTKVRNSMQIADHHVLA
jgi:nitrilase